MLCDFFEETEKIPYAHMRESCRDTYYFALQEFLRERLIAIGSILRGHEYVANAASESLI